MKRSLCLLVLLALCLAGCAREVPPEETADAVETGLETQAEHLESGFRWLTVSVPETAEGEIQETDGEGYFARHMNLPEEARYVGGGDVFAVCMDGPVMNQGNHFWLYAMTENGLSPLENRELEKEYLLSGNSVRLKCKYGIYDGDKTYLTYVPVDWDEVQNIRYLDCESLDRWLVAFPYALEEDRVADYPVILDPQTGEMTDFLGSLGQEQVARVLSEPHGVRGTVPGLNRAVLVGKDRLLAAMNGGGHACFDPAGGEIYDLDELCGEALENCAVLPDGSVILCWTEDKVWQIPTETMTAEILLEGVVLKFARGIRSGGMGSSFFLYEQQGELRCYDALREITFAVTDLGGQELLWDGGQESPDGRRFYVPAQGYRLRDDGVSYPVYSYCVFDCDSRMLTALEITGAEGLSMRGWQEDGCLLLEQDMRRFSLVYLTD